MLMKRIFLSIVYILISITLSFAQKGENLSFVIDASDIYPGTRRTISVYVPSTYTAKEPACIAIMMDGIIYGLSDAIEDLSASGQMPVTIAVGIEPGKILDKDGNVIRYNRSNEFDRTDGVFASFLEKEVIPMVKTLVTSDNRKILISDRSEDRMVLGASSGAIAAFAAAWNRPDLFSRVYSIVGTYVPMRGADQLPGIIRKAEPKQIRVYLQDNDKDSWNLLFGSWYEYNLLMNSALEYAGYQVEHHWDEGGHNGNNGAAIMKDALKYLWEGWPNSVELGHSGNDTMNSIIDPSSQWKKVENTKSLSKQSFAGQEAIYPGGDHIAKIEGTDNWISNYTRSKEGKLSNGEEFYYLYEPAKAVKFDNEGYLYCLTNLGIEVCDQNGRVRTIISTPYGEIVESFDLVASSILVKCRGNRYYSREIKRSGLTDPETAPTPKSEGQG